MVRKSIIYSSLTMDWSVDHWTCWLCWLIWFLDCDYIIHCYIPACWVVVSHIGLYIGVGVLPNISVWDHSPGRVLPALCYLGNMFVTHSFDDRFNSGSTTGGLLIQQSSLVSVLSSPTVAVLIFHGLYLYRAVTVVAVIWSVRFSSLYSEENTCMASLDSLQ